MSIDLKNLLKHTQTLNVLFAEDNYDVRVQLMKLLENFFSNIDVVIDGLEALNKYNEYYYDNGKHYDLIITDLSMPRFDGIDFCKKVSQINPNQTILVISAHTESEKLIQLIDIGIYKFLQKPVDYKDLLSTISSISEKLKTSKCLNQLENEVKCVKNNNEILNKLAITDKLTSIYNRRYIDNYLLKKIDCFKNCKNNKLSLIFIDIDNFKKINDTYGHLIGDKVLIEFVNLIKSNICDNEIFGRWGGEEFIIILENCIDEAVQTANNIKKLVEEYIFTKNLKITSSFGVSSYKCNETLSSLVQKADYALYQAKKNGKNQTYSIK